MSNKYFLFLLSFALTAQSALAVMPVFSDVPQDAWYAGYVDSLKEAGVVDAGEYFRPADSLNRAELVKMVITAIDGLKGHTPPPHPTFDDVKPGDWYTNYIEAAATLGITTGYADAQGNLIGLFGPADTVNRAAATKMLVEAFGLEETSSPAKGYPDVNPSDWFYDYVRIAGQHGVVTGYDNGRFGPSDAVTRAQIAKMMVLGMQAGGLMEALPPINEEVTTPPADVTESPSTDNTPTETPTLPQATPNSAEIEAGNTPAGVAEVFVARYTFKAHLEGFRVETVTVVNDITGDLLGDELEGTTAIKNVVLKYPDKAGQLVSESRSLGSDGKARFSNLSFFAPRDEEAFFEVYAELNSFSEVGEALSGEVFRLGLQDTNNDDSTFRAVGDISGYVIGYGGSRLAVTNSQAKPFTVRKSVPHFSINSSSDSLNNGEDTLLSFNVMTDPAGSIGLARLAFELSVSDSNAANLSLSDFKLYRGSTYIQNAMIFDGTGTQDIRLGSGNSLTDGSSTVIVTFEQEETVGKGDSVTYSLRANVSGSEANDSISTRLSQGDEETALSGLTATNQPNTGKVYVNADAMSGIFSGANDFFQTPGVVRDIIWSDKSADSHLYPTVSGGAITTDSGSDDWTNGYLLNISALSDHLITK